MSILSTTVRSDELEAPPTYLEKYEVGDRDSDSYDKSPYADAQMVILEVGTTSTQFVIHGTFLRQSTELASRYDPWSTKKQPVSLPELDDPTAHTLVHFLYTGKYNSLKIAPESEKFVFLNYKLGTCVYCAAVRYKLPQLAELAKERITYFGEDTSITEILAMARDKAFPLLPDDETWYPAYLEGAIKSAMIVDAEPFRQEGFLSQVSGHPRLLNIAWKTVTNFFANAAAASSIADSELTGNDVPLASEETGADEIASLSDAENSASIPESQPVEHSVAEPVKVTALEPSPDHVEPEAAVEKTLDDDAIQNIAEQTETLKLDEIEPTIEAAEETVNDQSIEVPKAPEPFTDELGFGASSTYLKMGKKVDAAPLIVQSPTKASEKPTHKRSDSVILDESVASVPKEGAVRDVEPTPSESVEAVDDEAKEGEGDAAGESAKAKTTKKSKNKSKKKKNTAAF